MNTKEPEQRVKRRCIFFQPDVDERLNKLAAQGVVVSRVIATALRLSLPKIEKELEAGKMKELRPRTTTIRNY